MAESDTEYDLLVGADDDPFLSPHTGPRGASLLGGAEFDDDVDDTTGRNIFEEALRRFTEKYPTRTGGDEAVDGDSAGEEEVVTVEDLETAITGGGHRCTCESEHGSEHVSDHASASESASEVGDLEMAITGGDGCSCNHAGLEDMLS